VGLWLAFLRERADRSFYNVEEVQGFLNIAVLGTIPRVITKRDRGRIRKKKFLDWTIFCISIFIITGAFVYVLEIIL